MARKVFISVLGSTNYGECIYESKENKYISEKIRFIQEATLQMIGAEKWEVDSAGYVFVTEGEKGSYDLNWKDNGHKDRDTQNIIPCEGLKTRLDKLNLPFKIENPIFIKDGNSEDEIWEVFETVFSQLNDNDEIYFDVTHGFRYLPMLILVLANYSKFLKNIKVKSISYGNYEGRDFQTGVAPIINLTSFSQLQDWTSASSNFIINGKTDQIINLLKASDSNLNDRSKEIVLLNDVQVLFETCRSKLIYQGSKLIAFKHYLNLFKKNNPFKPLGKILDKINSKVDKFDNNSLQNVSYAVEWCYNYGMYQQAITIGQEFVLSVALDLMFDDQQFKSKKDTRMAMNSFLTLEDNIFNNDSSWVGSLSKLKKHFVELRDNDIILSIRSTECDSLVVVNSKSTFYKALSDLRNQINHGGVTDNTTPESFILGFKDLMERNINHLNELGANYKINLN